MSSLASFRHVLQDRISPKDRHWTFTVPNLPKPQTLDTAGLIKSLTFVSSRTSENVELRLVSLPSNRVTRREQPHNLLLVSFQDFRLRQTGPPEEETVKFAPARDSADYIANVLKTGISINGVLYNFFGHSNSQQKSRSCFMLARTKEEIETKVDSLGNFSKLKSVGKKVKRIGLLFSSAEVALTLDPSRCQDVPDITNDGYTFTDGCGLIAPHLAKDVARRRNIVHRNSRYLPAVFQIRYRGYKGVLTLHPDLKGEIQVQFRNSMKKFGDVDDHSFAVVEYSKVSQSMFHAFETGALTEQPYSFGYLNDEVVLLLHALAISTATLTKKQGEHLEFLRQSYAGEPHATFQFLSYQAETVLAEKLLLDGPEAVRSATRKLIKSEYTRMLNKRDEQRCRIMIPKSRLLFGVCDPYGILKSDTCFVRITNDGDGLARTIIGTEILCTRNPTLHPGDLRKLRTMDAPQLHHLVDCIVFPTCGSRPSADLMSGGDLDGDKFFVTWDPDIIPQQLAPAAAYPGVQEKIATAKITGDDRAEFFAKASNTSLGLIKNLYLRWARLEGPLSAECQQLNRLFSQCVDGNRVKIPPNLEDPKNPEEGSPPFILDVLHDSAKAIINAELESHDFMDSCDVMDLLSSRDKIAMSEFELIQLTIRACDKDHVDFMDFSSYFNYSALSDEQRSWLLSRMPVIEGLPNLVMNGMMQSEILLHEELRIFGLDNSNIHWKPVFSSGQDRMGRFLESTCKALETFHKKLIVMSSDERLTLLIFIPAKIERASDVEVDTAVRVFALPHSSGTDSAKYQVKPTKTNSRLYCDGGRFQLYEEKRGNTFVCLQRPEQNIRVRQGAKITGEKRQKMKQSFEEGVNAECIASVALNKIGAPIQRHIGRMNRAPVIAAEIYAISNRDVESMRYLDMWLHYVDTKEILPLFETKPNEYKTFSTQDIDRETLSPLVAAVVLDHKLSALQTADNLDELRDVLELLNKIGQKERLHAVCCEILAGEVSNSDHAPYILRLLLEFLPKATFLTETVLQSNLWKRHKDNVREFAEFIFPSLLRALVLSCNRLQAFVKAPFRCILQELEELSIQQLVDLIELIALSIEQPEFAIDLLLECIEPECSRLVSGSDAIVAQLVSNLVGVALEHIDEAASGRKLEQQMLSLRPDGLSDGFAAVKATLRIDMPGASLKVGDHLRFVAASRPLNVPLEPLYTMDAIVVHAEQGAARFRCLHQPPSYVADCSWKYKNSGSFVTSKAIIDAISTFYNGKSTSCAVYTELTGDNLLISLDDISAESIESSTLNDSQRKALSASLQHRLALLWGPPGTGKTNTIVVILKTLLRTLPKSRMLVAAPTHNAVDNILQRYLDLDRSDTYPKPLRVSTQFSKVAPKLRPYTCDAMIGKDITGNFAGRREAQKRVKESSLVFTTCVGAGLGLLRAEKFDVVIVDEASQQTEPETLIPLTKGCKRVILVGDHVQLRATVQRHATISGFDISLFERLYTRNSFKDGIARVMLDTQYRMHPDICNFSSKEFYDGKLKTAPELSRSELPASAFPWPPTARKVFVQCGNVEDIGHQSKSNKGQAQLTQTICTLLKTAGNVNDNTPSTPSIAILTPYTRQRQLLESMIPDVTISSIDGFQGREADIIVFVSVRCNPHFEIGFLKDLRRLNVAMTRARLGVIIVGDRTTLIGKVGEDDDEQSKQTWKRLLDGCQEVQVQSGVDPGNK